MVAQLGREIVFTPTRRHNAGEASFFAGKVPARCSANALGVVKTAVIPVKRLLYVIRSLAVTLALCPASIGDIDAADVPAKVARVAFVYGAPALPGPTLPHMRKRLRELGWIEGQNLIIDEFWGDGNADRLPELMQKALARNPDVLVTSGTRGALAAKQATTTVPIVVASMGDPVQSGVVSNLARPGGNLTATSTGYVDGFAGKWLELLAEATPKVRRVAVLWNLSNPVVQPYQPDLEHVARARGITLQFIDVRERGSLDSAFRKAKQSSQASVVVCENLFIDNMEQVVELATKYRLPTVYCLSRFVRVGGLMSYGTDLSALYRRAAEYVDKILRGTNPGDLPIEQARTFELVVNLRTAKALGITMPESILLRADEVIR